MDLVRDLLDKQVVDRNGRELGRVDTVILELRDDGPPLVAAIEIGPSALGRRVHPFFGRCAAAIEKVFGADENRPVRVPFSRILEFEDAVKLDRMASETSALALEQEARTWVAALPGSK